MQSYVHPLQNPAFWVFVIGICITIMWALVIGATTFVFHRMEFNFVPDEDERVRFHFGFKRISPDGLRYQWWADNQWLEADEFLERCSGLGMSEESMEMAFGFDSSTILPKL